ncbi:MAG: tRNA (adenosine(37)-N6)-threonylcarbamoyltransferase complex dimerization subunit type 1 TsaB [Bacteroidales bacterium]|nr:tRNA (adenosine(37)-N6)-threonylcarbamoyltransferase complex dimerization subunit type 1 TsaB [Bacteroidales bacterium]
MKQSLILSIETSGAACSVALAKGGMVEGSVTIDDSNRQSSMLVPAIESLFKQCSRKMSECDAVAVSSGPGSYTGLRVGVSTAKGLCYGLGKPLISVPTLEILLAEAMSMEQCAVAVYFVPMLDARRMEVYQAVYGADGSCIEEVSAKVLDAGSYADLLEKGRVVFIGTGAGKYADAFPHPNGIYVPSVPKASFMAAAAQTAYDEERFEDVAYFEPFYLKEFVAIVKKNPIIIS